MKVLLLTFGTDGDVRPFVALGRRLQSNGHDVALCTAGEFAPLVAGSGVPLLSFGDDWYAINRALMDSAGNVGDLARGYKTLLGAMEQSMDGAWQVAADVGPDVVVFHPKMLAGPHVAERLGVPGLLAAALPIYHATGSYPSAILPRLPRPLWAVGYTIAGRSAAAYGPMVSRFRARIGLARRAAAHPSYGIPTVRHGTFCTPTRRVWYPFRVSTRPPPT